MLRWLVYTSETQEVRLCLSSNFVISNFISIFRVSFISNYTSMQSQCATEERDRI